MIRFPNEKHGEVRLAINASILQQLFGSGYYYYESLAVPVVEDHNVPSLKLQQHQDSESSDAFKNLWLSFCSHLTRNQNDFNLKNNTYIKFFIVLWVSLFTMFSERLLYALICGDTSSALQALLIYFLLVIPVFHSVKEIIYYMKMLMNCFNLGNSKLSDEYYQALQKIVDDMASHFSREGFTLDYVEDHQVYKPSLVYIRITNICKLDSQEEDDKVSESLSKRLEAYQQQTREEYTDLFAERWQDQNRKQSGTFLFGLSFKKVAPWRKVWTNVLVSICFVLSFFSIISQMTMANRPMYETHYTYRVNRIASKKALVEVDDDASDDFLIID
jgi:hypothetical protein